MSDVSHGNTDHQGKDHDYHLVDPSPWPALGALAGGILLGGAVLYFHTEQFWMMIIGFVLTIITMRGWWRDVVREGHERGDHTPVVQRGLRFGMILFIASEVMFFAAFFWAFFNASLKPTEFTDFTWPPADIELIPAWELPFFNTLLLLTSGATCTWAHHALKHNNQKHLIWGLALTVALGIIFLCVQGYEYAHAAFGFREGIYPSTFFMATGFHGFHVTVGAIFLGVCLIRAIKGQLKPNQHIGFEAAAWYWHFVDVVWLFLFIWIYWWGGA